MPMVLHCAGWPRWLNFKTLVGSISQRCQHRLLSPFRTALRPSPLPSRPKVLAFLAQRRVSWRSPTTSAQRRCPYSRAARALYWFPLSAWCYLAGLDVERVEPEAAPRTMVHLFGVGVAFLV